MGYETRLVQDLTDHVWTEIFIVEEDRWAHMDACENAFDAPKMYEQGWGKKLTYCFAINTEEVVDVTKRYVINSWKNKLRRTAVPEGWLLNMLANVKVDMQANMSGERREELAMRQQIEEAMMESLLEEYQNDTQTNEAENQVRQTGSLEWRE